MIDPLYRMAIGFCLAPFGTWWFGADSSGWYLLPLFLLVLLSLRLGPAIVRRLLPVSDDLRARWAHRRLLGKRFDSYQWRKLVWFGLGIVTYLVLVGRIEGIPAGLAMVCLAAGCLGEWRWRHVAPSERVDAFLTLRAIRPEPPGT